MAKYNRKTTPSGRPVVMTEERVKACRSALANTEATVEDIAKRFGVTKGTIYRTCGSKEACMRAKLRWMESKLPGPTEKSQKRMAQRARAKARAAEAQIEW